MSTYEKWPKIFPKLSVEQQNISNDFVKYWHERLSSNKTYTFIEKFNHTFPIKRSPHHFEKTLEVGAGLGEHLEYETLTPEQEKNYVALELRDNMAKVIQQRFPNVMTCIADCQQNIPYVDNYFDRIIAIHVLEHLPNLPKALQEIYRICNKEKCTFLAVIPCEGGFLYNMSRKISAQRIFEKRYKQSYQWFIEREHVNRPHEILEELSRYFYIQITQYFPFTLKSIQLNLCIGIVCKPKKTFS